ncbi:leucine-rich repeat-containing protein typical subtype : Repeat-companion domain protein OS=Isosphaera pallida (strain ATCC 43644 / DSM 9630 / IS1B) GN=Isop_0537 PE=4 SV=1: LRR_6: LRR_6: LRR_6 [Gemmata massiliana]|uniref:Repeat-companion domain protein n=1 Tax=Gemmata massiliana TaxID=1210884 RepID=A0A6P2CSN3_9BACT|nr:TIGR02996 domain-containing protein [Gemmata massiliana]VTR91941.1 leucine-rich repeat-containing protein typical subtype : Repeat-companion domain protein OS=Isosphaera pallida (strain ATCC 43644 / DSM 9630 / IS1B) GN=Isop_0537 PE=4 SV=1: LRR_6: LRR_6: LRR_6 [Gemmata massiliana]
MNERDALLRAVCDTPDDDTPRLVFADWLQEHGDEARAEFIRVQIALARGDASARLKEREQELFAAHQEVWEQPFEKFKAANSFRNLIYDVFFHRGFIRALVICDEEKQFADHATEVFQLAPIQRITFFHKWPHAASAECAELLRLKELRIYRAGFETKALGALLRSKSLLNVTRLELIADNDNGYLTAEGIELLSRSTALPALRHLDLSYNCIWLAILTEGDLIGQLESLKLRCTDIDDSGAEVLARCERLRSLTHLDLTANRIGDRGLRALATSRNLPRLTTLDLRHNLYDTEGGVEIRGCTPETRQILEDRFGAGVLIDGRLEE